MQASAAPALQVFRARAFLARPLLPASHTAHRPPRYRRRRLAASVLPSPFPTERSPAMDGVRGRVDACILALRRYGCALLRDEQEVMISFMDPIQDLYLETDDLLRPRSFACLLLSRRGLRARSSRVGDGAPCVRTRTMGTRTECTGRRTAEDSEGRRRISGPSEPPGALRTLRLLRPAGRLVRGEVSPNGWCRLFQAKAG
jgi:hypothetical protein